MEGVQDFNIHVLHLLFVHHILATTFNKQGYWIKSNKCRIDIIKWQIFFLLANKIFISRRLECHSKKIQGVPYFPPLNQPHERCLIVNITSKDRIVSSLLNQPKNWMSNQEQILLQLPYESKRRKTIQAKWKGFPEPPKPPQAT